MESNAIAVVGMSCRFPESDNVEEFWDLLVNGKDGIREPPTWRWAGYEYLAYDPDVRHQKAGFLKCPVDEFDAKLFGISPREAELMDPQQRLLLEVTWESLENAGINPLELKGTRTGVFSGIWRHDYETLLTKYSPNCSIGIIDNFMGNSFSAISGRIAYQLGLTGPNIATESGCASSMISLHLACQSLTSQESDLTIVGGVNLLLHPFTTHQGIKDEQVLAADGKCKTFDALADGYGRAEGCASLVLKRYSDALENGDRILALIRGSAMSQEGSSKNFGTPTKEGQVACIQAATKRGGISPNMVSYVEAHGTGTIAGDPVEIAALSEVYSLDRKVPLWIGSVKTNIGHTESCSGLAGIIKVILAMEHKTIPPHINCNKINPKIDLKVIPACIPKEAMEWKKYGDAPRIAGVSSFGMTGANVHVIIQEAPAYNGVPQDSNMNEQSEHETYQILAISGKSEYSLKQMAIQYKHFLESHPKAFENFCYTVNVCRAIWNRRIAIIGRNAQEIIGKLEKGLSVKEKDISSKAKVVFLFTGQGSQYVRMGENLYKNHLLFRHHFDECSKLLKKHTNIILPELLTTNDTKSELSIFCIQYCLWRLWENVGVIPDFIIGHSMGEYAASVAAGILKLEDALQMLIERSNIIDGLPEGQMLAVKAGIDRVNDLLKTFLDKNESVWLDVAAINSDCQTVIAGRNQAIKMFGEFCSDNSLKSTLISSRRAYHSRDMEAANSIFDKRLSKVSYGIPKYKYISSTTGKMVTDIEVNKNYWKRNIRMAVNFKKAFDFALEQGGRVFVEIGPQPVLLNIGSSIASADISNDCLWVPSMKRSGNEWKTFLEGVGNLFVNGFDVDWKSFYRNLVKQKIAIPTYPFEHSKKYWAQRQTKIFPIANFSGKQVHPLIGKKNFIPETDKVFHQQDFCLENLGYFKDHVIVNKIIVPGACFLEMIISAGHSVVQKSLDGTLKPVTPVVVTEFDIKSALELQEDSICSIYIYADGTHDNRDNRTYIKISRKIVDDCGQVSWVEHATGLFSCSQDANDCVLDLEKIKTSSTSRESTEMYSFADKAGWNFGKSFKSIKKIWENEREVLAQINVTENSEGYNLHPIIIDGIFHSLVLSPRFGGVLKHLALPTGIKKFVLFPSKTGNGQTFYSHFLKSNDLIVTLYDEIGNRVATAEGIDLTETFVSQFIKALDSQKLSLPALHEVVWRKVTNDGLDDTPNSIDDNPQNSMWLLFADGNVSTTLKEKLEVSGKTVITVNRGLAYSKLNDEYIIDPNDRSQIIQIFEKLNTVSVDGVIYMWGIDTENKSIDQNCFCKPFLIIIQKLIKRNFCKQLILVTKGGVSTNGGNVNNPAVNTLLGLLKSAKAEQPSHDYKSIDLDSQNDDWSLDADEIMSLINNSKREIQYASREQTLFTPRLSKVNLPRNAEIPVSKRFSLNVPISNSIMDLSISASNLSGNLKENEIEVSVIAVALNFRDIMVIMKPEGYYTKYPFGIGTDFSGTVTNVGSAVTKFKFGDSVTGYTYNGSISSHAITPEYFLVKKPNEMTHFEAACLPVVLSTAFYTIVNIGQLSSKDTILIHSASGGVGLMAIQIAQRIGAKIILTAGSERKRLYLKSLGVDHVFNSRTTDYGKDIARVTDGKGVDVVLNTLTGANFKETTLSVCSQNARFIEISKANIWQPADVAALRPDVQYTLFDLEQLDEKSSGSLLCQIVDCRPIPYTRFELGQVKDAFKYLQKAQHIGKVVIAIPQFEIEEGKPKLSCKLFNEESTYLITGGLGGIGMEVAKWMLSLGAKFIVLVGRRQPDENILKILQSYNSQGANVITIQADVSVYEECERLFHAVKNSLPPLRGIMHAAGVLADGVIENQSWENFETTFRPKVNGTWNLHKLSLGCNLEHFVLFSSITSTVGSIGQSSYIAANAFLDSFVHFRKGLGLPSQCINWGAWSEVGMAANSSHFSDGLYGIIPFSTKRGLSALKSIMQSNYSQITVSDLQPSTTLHSFPHLKTYLSELNPLVKNTKDSHKNVHFKNKKGFLDEIKIKSPDDQLNIILLAVKSIVSSILNLDESDSVNCDEPLVDLGMDSLMTVEFRNDLQDLLGDEIQISSSILLDHPSVETLSKYILNAISLNMKASDENLKHTRVGEAHC